MKARRQLNYSLLAIFLAGIWVTAVQAQSNTMGCSLQQVGNTSRQVLKCRKGVSITVEAGARYSLIDRDQDGDVDGVVLRRKALLLEVRQRQQPGFVVITPQAIAAVRGTKWATDVQRGKTAVFVVDGRVGVTRANASAGVVLRPGEGVDVDTGTGPLTVRRWPAARADALLARPGE